MKNNYIIAAALVCLSNNALATSEIKAPLLGDVPVSKSVSISGPVLDQATALAKLIRPVAKIESQILGTIEVTLPQILKSDPQFSILEKAYPGLIAAIVESIKPKMLAAYAQKTPLLWDRLGAIYANNLSSSELDSMMAFYKSPIGQKILDGFSQIGSNANLLKQALDSSTVDMDRLGTAANKDMISNAKKISATLSDAEMVTLFKFENSPLGVKLALLIPEIQKTVIEWDLYFTPEQMNDFTSARSAAITAFIAETDAKKSQKPNDASEAPVGNRT